MGCLSVVTSSGLDPRGWIQNLIVLYFPVHSSFQQSKFACYSLPPVPLWEHSHDLEYPLTLLQARSSSCQTPPWTSCLFSLVLAPEKVHYQFAKHSGILCWFPCIHKPLSFVCALYLYGGWYAVKNTETGVRNLGSLCVWPWALSPFLWASVSTSVRWRVISSVPIRHICGQEVNVLKCVKMCFVMCISYEIHVCIMSFLKSGTVSYTVELCHMLILHLVVLIYT